MSDWHTPAHLRALTNAIVHIDGDSFFASCEQAMHPEWKGKPVVTGKERGIASAMSYEAKKAGVHRGMILSDVKKVCPEAIIVASDYESYSLFSKRMFSIMRRFTNVVEEYGVDEGFADITGMRQSMGINYLKMARLMKEQVEKELGITVSVGLAPTKVLAKLASKWDKPDGFVYISGRKINDFLKTLPVGHVWGIGPNTAAYMNQLGIYTALDFIKKDRDYIEWQFTKPHQELWHELQGTKMYNVNTEEKTSYASISKTKTFTPASTDKEFVFSQLVKNLENACIKARRYDLVAKKVYIFIKEQNFQRHGMELELTRASAYPSDITKLIRPLFDTLYQEDVKYRSTGVILSGLQEETNIQGSLFEAPVKLQNLREIYEAVDAVAKKFGKHTLHLAGSLKANTFDQHAGERGEISARQKNLLKGERGRRRLGMPVFSGIVK